MERREDPGSLSSLLWYARRACFLGIASHNIVWVVVVAVKLGGLGSSTLSVDGPDLDFLYRVFYLAVWSLVMVMGFA